MSKESKLHFKCNSPCSSCPYRKDAKLQLWDKAEFERLQQTENDYMGAVYACHKKNGSVCIGWLMMQDKNRFPSIALRIKLSQDGVTRKYLDSLHSPVEMFETTQEMIEENYPELA